jgi:hypothetical protein
MNMNRSIRLVLLFALLFRTTAAFAQGVQNNPSPAPAPTNEQPAANPSPQPATSPTPGPSPKVTAVNGHLELDDIVEVYIQNLQAWAHQKETNDPTKLVPYINGRVIKGNYPEELHLERGRLIFHLQITPESKDAWTDLLGEPSGLKRPVTLTVGLENGTSFDSVHTKDNPLNLTIISPIYGIIALLIIFATFGLLLWLARKTNIIRETGPPAPAGKRRPYNLGRAQMAFWFFLIYASYTTIWLITSTLDTITPSLLALMGISAGTALGEALIDNGKETAKTNQLQDLTAERQAIDQTMTEVQSEVDKLNSVTRESVTDQANRDALTRQLVAGRTRIGQIEQQVRAINSQSAPTISAGFLRDILSDGSGYSFHRFQIFAWTIILGIIFVSSVYNDLTMPEFSPTLLGLMGLSAGTYIGFKFPEQK